MNPSLRAIITGTGMAVPKEVLGNDHFESYLDTSDEWITTRSGIKHRHRAGEGETTVSLALEASQKAIEDAGINPEDLDLILFATVTPDTFVPSAACWLQGALGAKNAGAMDLNAACAGLIYGMTQAAMYLNSGMYKHILIVGAETLSRITDTQDRATVVLFGDGASAVIMSHTDDPERGVLYQNLGADGTCADYIWLPAGGSRLPNTQATLAEKLDKLRMKGREVYKFAVVKFNRLVQKALKETGLKADQIDLIIPHQSNLRIIESVQEKMKLPMDKFVVNIDRYGNTSAASVGMALDEARRDGRVQPGNVVMMIAFGAGLTWAVMVVRI
ncbi:MAG TPA: beta-ketoacyl-ACP synthase III [Phycisphaerae bacterium]|nr:beta-ketoacyl-ACP synthase III [Phycisphaerae bacterium]